MEGIGSFFDEEWESLSNLFSSEEDSDNLLLHLNGSNFFQNEIPSTFYCASENAAADHTNFYCVSQESSNSSEIGSAIFSNQASGVNFHPDLTNNSFESIDTYTMDCKNDNSTTMPVSPDDVMEEILQLKGNEEIHPCKEMQLKRKYETPSIDQDNISSESPKKKPRVTRNKNKKNVQSKKNKKADQIEDENNSGGIVNSSISSSTSEDDSQELNSKGKARATRGAATDPQSLYARRRRERINERLKILQNLVPNGTKVDISTMLEEAVHYVKFLQLQIKLLSSDDHWMYAPIAYNGMDIGLFQKIVPNMWIQH